MSRRILGLAAAALALLAPVACDSPTGTTKPTAARLEIVSGDLQTATVNTELAQPLVVRVTDEQGHRVKGQIINFRVTAGNGSVFAGSAITDNDGEARERWTLGTVAGDTQKVEARAVDPQTGAPLVFATFRAIATPGSPSSISAAGATSFTGFPLTPLADSVAAVVRDVYGNPVPGATVVWTVSKGGGTASPGTSTTGATGVARTSWTLGGQLDSLQVIEAAAGLTLKTQFTANGQVPGDAVLVKVSGDAQTDTVPRTLAQPLVVRVQRANGTPVAGIPVTFTTGSGGSLSPATVVSDAQGLASTNWTLGTTAGVGQATASISTGSHVAFAATARPGPAFRVASTVVSGRLVVHVRSQVTDAYGNGIAGVTVAWAPEPGNGSVSPASAVTGVDGTAETDWSLEAIETAQTLNTSAAGLATTTAYIAPPGDLQLSLTLVSGDRQSGITRDSLPDPLVVRAMRGGQPVGGITVNWRLYPETYPGATASYTTVTGADGYSSLRPQVPATPEWFVVNAKVTGDSVNFREYAQKFEAAPHAVLLTGVGQGGPLVVTVQNQATTLPITWSSDDPSVVSVDASGQVQAQAKGYTVIRARYHAAYDSVLAYVALPMSADSVSAGEGGCAVDAGSLLCWGNSGLAYPAGLYGQLPLKAPGSGWTATEVGSQQGCALKGQQAYCWGVYAAGTPGTPTPVAGHDFVQVAVGTYQLCAIDTAQKAWCWGRNDNGILGTGDELYRAQPDSVLGGHQFTQIAAGSGHTCALDTTGAAWCWGANSNGELGVANPLDPCSNGQVVCRRTPVAVQGGKTFTQLIAGLAYTCGLDAAGKAWCWGWGQFGVVPGTTSTPAAVPGGVTFASISGGQYHACGVTAAGAGYCWGYMAEGRLGNGTESFTPNPTPQPVSGGHVWRQISAGMISTCGVTTSRAVYCWGQRAQTPTGIWPGHPDYTATLTVPTRALSTW